MHAVVRAEHEVLLTVRQTVGEVRGALERGVARHLRVAAIAQRRGELSPREREGGIEGDRLAQQAHRLVEVVLHVVRVHGLAVLSERFERRRRRLLQGNRAAYLLERFAHPAAELARQSVDGGDQLPGTIRGGLIRRERGAALCTRQLDAEGVGGPDARGAAADDGCRADALGDLAREVALDERPLEASHLLERRRDVGGGHEADGARLAHRHAHRFGKDGTECGVLARDREIGHEETVVPRERPRREQRSRRADPQRPQQHVGGDENCERDQGEAARAPRALPRYVRSSPQRDAR